MTPESIFRDRIIESLRRELVGPLWISQNEEDINEVLQESPILRYSAGVLFPNSQVIIEGDDTDNLDKDNLGEAENNDEIGDKEISIEVDEKSELLAEKRQTEALSTAYDETVRLANEFYPSAIGISFIANIPENGLIIQARAAIYKSKKNDVNPKYREWQRKVLEIDPIVLHFKESANHYFDNSFDLAKDLKLRAIGYRRHDNTHLITVSLLNTKQSTTGKSPSGEDCFFQSEFEVTANGQYSFHEYHTTNKTLKDHEDIALELLYSKRKAFAVGHGCAAEWGDEKDGCANKVMTSIVPSFKVAPVEPRTEGGNELSMYFLSGGEESINPTEIPIILENLSKDYKAWIVEQKEAIYKLPIKFHEAANTNLNYCLQCLKRIKAGINLLKSNKKMLFAFMLANQAILMQQYHFRCEKRSLKSNWKDFPVSYKPKDKKSGYWRTFQIAFILMNLQSLISSDTDEDNSERKIVDLIWFPTGGGKTEAYFGLAACDIFYRRLINPNNAGCTVLMRYTLRLLTAQQFQRASSLISACEILRRKNQKELGKEAISIGLWVGDSLTYNLRTDACSAVNELTRNKKISNKFQLIKCPWCGTELDNTQNLGYVINNNPKTVIFVCPDKRCFFSKREERLPIVVIDEDIYETPPTLIIGTVDKFAMLAWKPDSSRIFGLSKNKSFDPPDLIIQDELHLISGPLGSVVGLYESAIDLLCSWKGRLPKIVASTATIRRASQQCLSLYDRETFQFPPQGIDISDSFFAVENKKSSGRVYTGVFATAASSSVNAMIKVISSLLQSCKSIPLPEGTTEEVRDPYWTLVQYFNSLRELGQALTLVEFSIPEYIQTIAKRTNTTSFIRRYLSSEELTSRRTADEIPKILERLEVKYPKLEETELKPLDTLLATNMISVGVDVSRLGLMAVAGQPKTTSEYIQATSRVGRSEKAPGLVVTLYNPSRPRDRSHYEHFRAYHSAFYKFVEPTSVTPFSLPVLNRTLNAILVIIARHLAGIENPDEIDSSSDEITKAINFITLRCQKSSPEHADVVLDEFNKLLKQWENIKPGVWGRFGKPPEDRPLMYPAGTEPLADWGDTSWPVPTSMRNVDVECEARIVPEYIVSEHIDPNERE